MQEYSGNTNGKYSFKIVNDTLKFKFYNVSESSLKGNLIGMWSEALFNIKWKEGEVNIVNTEFNKELYTGHWGSLRNTPKHCIKFSYEQSHLCSPVFRNGEDLDSLLAEIDDIKSKHKAIED